MNAKPKQQRFSRQKGNDEADNTFFFSFLSFFLLFFFFLWVGWWVKGVNEFKFSYNWKFLTMRTAHMIWHTNNPQGLVAASYEVQWDLLNQSSLDQLLVTFS